MLRLSYTECFTHGFRVSTYFLAAFNPSMLERRNSYGTNGKQNEPQENKNLLAQARSGCCLLSFAPFLVCRQSGSRGTTRRWDTRSRFLGANLGSSRFGPLAWSTAAVKINLPNYDEKTNYFTTRPRLSKSRS